MNIYIRGSGVSRLRKRLNVSLEVFAKMLCLNESLVRAWEKEDTILDCDDQRVIVALAEKNGISPESLC